MHRPLATFLALSALAFAGAAACGPTPADRCDPHRLGEWLEALESRCVTQEQVCQGLTFRAIASAEPTRRPTRVDWRVRPYSPESGLVSVQAFVAQARRDYRCEP